MLDKLERVVESDIFSISVPQDPLFGINQPVVQNVQWTGGVISFNVEGSFELNRVPGDSEHLRQSVPGSYQFNYGNEVYIENPSLSLSTSGVKSSRDSFTLNSDINNGTYSIEVSLNDSGYIPGEELLVGVNMSGTTRGISGSGSYNLNTGFQTLIKVTE